MVLRLSCWLGLHRAVLPRVGGESDETGALICNPCHGIRAIVLRRSPDGGLEIQKAALWGDAEPLRREQAALQRLSGRPGVPQAGPIVERDGAAWFSLPYLRDVPRGADPMPLLRSWETAVIEPAAENGMIRDLLPMLDESTRTALAGCTVRRALVHGDFAPWNWKQDGNGNLVCIDWEWAREDGIAGFDLVYSLVQQALLVKKVPANRLLPFVEGAASRLSPEGQSCLKEAGLPLKHLVHLVVAYRKSKGMDAPAPGGKTPSSPFGGGAHGAASVPHTPLPRFLVLEGADGVGKSTVLRLLVPELVRRGEYKGYLFFHWKPILGNVSYDAIPGDNPHDPRGEKTRNPVASLMFLAYHWLDFQIGYRRFVCPAIRTKRLVIADRYTYDVLLDPKRFRLNLPAWILRLFVQTIPRPEQAILLHADPAVIRARKPELTENEIADYQSALLSCQLIRGAMPIDAGRAPEEIVAEIFR